MAAIEKPQRQPMELVNAPLSYHPGGEPCRLPAMFRRRWPSGEAVDDEADNGGDGEGSGEHLEILGAVGPRNERCGKRNIGRRGHDDGQQSCRG